MLLHVRPTLGRTGLRRLRYQQIESLYDSLLHPTGGKGIATKTPYEIHLLIRNALADALRCGLVTRTVALVARAPKQRSLQKIEGQAWTDDRLRAFLRTAAGHRFVPLLWLTAMTGMRRNEVLGLKWPDIDTKRLRLSLNRGLAFCSRCACAQHGGGIARSRCRPPSRRAPRCATAGGGGRRSQPRTVEVGDSSMPS